MGGYKRAREEVGRETVYDNSTHGTEGSKAPVDGIEGGGNVVEVQDAG
jgi:hypothetical protein